MKIPEWRHDNVCQCWSCKNKAGQAVKLIDGYEYILPECKVSDSHMLEVYRNPCEKYIKNH